MDTKNYLSPAEITAFTSDVGVTKAKLPRYKQLMLAFLAGVFIAFASEGSNMAAFNLLSNPDTYGLGRFVAAIVFGTGLMLVVIAGGELFTGNTLLIVALLDKKITLKDMLSNWLYVYGGNLIGSLFIAVMMFFSGLFNNGGGLLGGMTIKIAYGKVNMPFYSALVTGIMCNWLVCLAVWMSYAAKDITGKILSIFFVIGLFITSGFEHCVANMYYIPAGILAKSNALWVEQSKLTIEQLNSLNWGSFFTKNLLPVTIGNIIGGAFFVGAWYWFVYNKKKD